MKRTVKTEIETFFDTNGSEPGLYSAESDLYLPPDPDKEEVKEFALAIECSEALVNVLLNLGRSLNDNDDSLNEDIKDLGRMVLE